MTRDTKRSSKADRAFHRPSVNKHWNRWVMSDLESLPRRTKCKKHKGLFFFLKRKETHALSKVNKRAMQLAVKRDRDLKYYEDIADDMSEDSLFMKQKKEQPVLPIIDKETLLHEYRLEEEEYWYCIYHELPTASY